MRGRRSANIERMPSEIAVTVRLFASLRETAGADRLSLSVPAGTPVGAVWGHLPEPLRVAARKRVAASAGGA